MSPLELGEAATEMVKAVVRGTGYPDSVPDTPEFRQLYEGIAADVDAMAGQGIAPEIPWDYNDDPDPEPIVQGAGVAPQIEQFTSEGLISDQLELAMAGDGEGILGQIIELAGSEAWRHERRGAHGEWAKSGSPSAALRRASVSPGRTGSSAQMRTAQRRAAANRAATHDQAHAAVASQLAEEHARKALEEAKAEVERVTAQLKDEAKTEENAKHRVKLAVHGLAIIAGAVLVVVMAKLGVNEVASAFGGIIPYLAIELTDWKKKL